MVVPASRTHPAEALPAVVVDLTPPRPSPEQAILVESKLQVPPIPRRAIVRHRLTDMLCGDERVALVSAPAGYGKSTLLAQWAGESELPVAWLTLDRDDSHPVRFWTHLIAALDRAVPGAFPQPVDVDLSAIDLLVCAVSNRLCSLQTKAIVILDDYHELRSADVDESVEGLIGQLPPEAKVVISTRRDPYLALSRLRAAEQLVEVRQRDLCFLEDEAAEWFATRDIEPTRDLVAESLSVTEGWPAALTLLFGSSRRASGPAREPGHRHVAEYIREEIVRDNEDDRAVLLVSAFCPQVSAALLDHTLDMSQGREALRRLEKSNVLLEQIDRSGEWYRLHRLVADHLLLGRESDPDVRRWMLRAAEWYTDNDRPTAALDMMIEAGEYSAACDLINRSWLDRLRSGQLATLRSDLSRIPPGAAEKSAPFLVTRAWLNAYDGRQREAVSELRRAESLMPSGPLPDGAPSVEAARAVINALCAVEGLPSVERSARRVDRLVDRTSAYRPLADLARGYAYFMTGNLATAQTAFDEVLASQDVLLRSSSVGWGTVIDVMEDRLESARARLDEAEPAWRDNPLLSKLPAVVVAKAALAIAEGRPLEAAASLEKSLSEQRFSVPTDHLEVLIWLAGAEVSIGRTQRAQQWLGKARHLIGRLGGSDWHCERLSGIEDRIGPTAEPLGWHPGLTKRETRILQLLSATHLSQREIGMELGISFNTIKSHVKAIYVKLGATNRDEASQIARHHGLI